MARARGVTRHAPALKVDDLLDDPQIRVLVCCGSGGVGQDHDRGRARAAGGRAGPAGGRADHRPGPAAGPVAGAGRAGQHPAPGAPAATRPSGGSLDAMMLDMKRTFDEVIEAHATPGEGRSRSSPTRSTRRCRARSPGRRSTWRWRSSASCGPRPTPRGEDGWDLIIVDTPPSRSALDFLDAPQRLGLVPGRAVHPAADRAGPDGRPGLPEGGLGRGQQGDRRPDRSCSAGRS